METILQQLKEKTISQVAIVDSIRAEIKRCLMEGTEQSYKRAQDLEVLILPHACQIAYDLRQSMMYLRRAAGHNSINLYVPECF